MVLELFTMSLSDLVKLTSECYQTQLIGNNNVLEKERFIMGHGRQKVMIVYDKVSLDIEKPTEELIFSYNWDVVQHQCILQTQFLLLLTKNDIIIQITHLKTQLRSNGPVVNGGWSLSYDFKLGVK